MDDRVLWSIDIKERYYLRPEHKVGFVAEKAKEVIGDLNFEHKLIGGKIVSEVLDDIGEGIDFLILDTAHKLPGEVMDFIACLPYLAENATVVVHDVALNFYSSEKSIATKVLFDTVTADKYKADEPKFIAKLANIAAFDINAETKKYIYDVFSCLTYTWAYMPGNNLIEGYGEIVKRCYDDMCQKLYAQAVELQRHHFEKGIMVMDDADAALPEDLVTYVSSEGYDRDAAYLAFASDRHGCQRPKRCR